MGKLRYDFDKYSPFIYLQNYSKSNTILTESAPSRCPEDRFIHRPIYGNGTLNSISKIKKRRVKPSPKIGEPIILISDLNSDHNVTKMVDQLLTKRELANDSSLIMVVPLSDDENGSSCGGFDSTVFNIHLADNSKWNKTPDQDAELASPLARKSHIPSGIRISTKGKRVLMHAEPSPVASTHGMDKTVTDKTHYVKSPHCERRSFYNAALKKLHYIPIPRSYCAPTPPTNRAPPAQMLHNFAPAVTDTHIRYASHSPIKIKNKLCQITTPMTKASHVVGTDTTDRPCCCPLKKQEPDEEITNAFNDQCINNYWSKFSTPPRIQTGLNSEDSKPRREPVLVEEPKKDQTTEGKGCTPFLKPPIAYRRRLMFSNIQNAAAWRNLVKVNNSLKAIHKCKDLRPIKVHQK